MAVYYVDMAVGDDGNLGTSEGEGNAWQTIDKAMNEVGAGDKVWVKGSADYTETAVIDTVGTLTSPIVFEGYTSVTGDGGRATITGSAARANCVATTLGGQTETYYVIKNFRITNATGSGWFADIDYITFKNVKFDSNGSHGCEGRTIQAEACEFEGNGGSGISKSGGPLLCVGCTFYSNGGHGIDAGGQSIVLYNCTFFSNASRAISAGGAGQILVVLGCTIDGDAKDSTDGIFMDHTQIMAMIVNSAIYDCATGINNNNGDMGERSICRNNLVNSNTADYNNFDIYSGEVTDAPNFVNEVDGADYTPDTDSPLIDAGFDARG